MCNVVEKTSKGKQKKGMIGQVNNQVFALGPTHNLKHVQCELKGKFKKMLVKERSCNCFEMFSYRRFVLLSINVQKGGHMI